MVVRVLVLLAAYAVLYGCGQASSPPEHQEQGEGKERVEQQGRAAAVAQRETTHQVLANVPVDAVRTLGVAATDMFSVTDMYSNPSRNTIPTRGEATPYPSAVSVSGLGSVSDVDVTLNGFSHTDPSDVKVELMGPSGSSVPVMSHRGGSADISNINITLKRLV